MILYGVVTHGGAGSPEEFSDGCDKAAAASFRMLESGVSALDAVVEAVRILEDDSRFNAGSGSVLRLDGKTIEMDAAVMDSAGNIGIVISIRDVKNPVLVARAVIGTPHVALSGQGATAFARKCGFPHFLHVSQRARERHERIRHLIREGNLGEENPLWRGHDIESFWNFDELPFSDFVSCDTVGAVAMDKTGRLAVATSTGGAAPMMLGRVGDSPLIGCGFYAGSSCAVAATGIGEEIIKKMLARYVYDVVVGGESVGAAAERGIGLFSPDFATGVIALSQKGYATASNRRMARAVLVREC